MLFTSIVLVVGFLVWMTVARVRRMTVVVLVALVLLGVGVTTLAAVEPRAVAESRLLLVLGVAVILPVARQAQQRMLPEVERPRRQWPFRVAIGTALLVIFGCFGAGSLVINGEPFVPSVRELGPLPDDIRLTRDAPPADGLECGSGTCYVSFSVHGRDDEPADRTAQRLRDHLTGQGWRLDTHGQDCEPTGWLLDRRTTCVSLGVRDGVARISLEGGRAHP